MKKIKKILPILLIVMLMIPFSSAFAYSGGLLQGKSLFFYSDYNLKDGSSTTDNKMTDNNLTTYGSLNNNGNSYDTVWYKFTEPKTIDKYFLKLDSNDSSSLTMKFYNESNLVIYTMDISNTADITNITPVNNVYGVALYNSTSSGRMVAEWDVYGTTAVPISHDEITALTATPSTNNVSLSWTNPTGNADFTGTKVYRDGALIASPSSNVSSYSDGGLTEDTAYVYKVSAVYSDGHITPGDTETTRTTITPVDVAPPAEINSLVSTVTDKGISLTFNNPEDADFNHVNVYVDGVLNGTSSTGAYQINGLTEKTSYVVNIKAVDNAGNESSGLTRTIITNATVDLDAPSVPTGVSVVPASNGAVVSYNRNTEGDILGYNVYVDGVKENATPITSLTYSILGLDAEKTYSITVSAVDTSLNVSPQSGAVSITTDKDLMPVLGMGYDLKDVADATGSQFSSIWLIIAFASAIPLSFYVAGRTKLLFLD